ncbi:hypothetical protein BHE74_00056048 [Ensete ventricosum]|nr:hypothetical protein BHE74_00056048 [Ensete ventricosum]RZR87241.1 hypothetical protein BHM03_00014611 [Ensete ventricosum]
MKAARRRGGQPRLAAMQGRPPTARPRPWPPVQGDDWLRPGPTQKGGQQRPQGAAAASMGKSTAHRHDRLQRSARKGGRLQDARKGLPPTANPTASRNDDANYRGDHPLTGRLPTDKGSRRLRRGSSDDTCHTSRIISHSRDMTMS